MDKQKELVGKVQTYFPGLNVKNLSKAYNFGVKAHAHQVRDSGDPFFSHPFEVATILAKMKLDENSVITGLLHDVIEDTLATKNDIKKKFGLEIASLVDGVTKLSKLNLQESNKSEQIENFRKFILAISEDIRVLFVKLADRLHNMRTLTFLKNTKRKNKIANETLEIYAPLAERIGVHKIKEELEDLAFAELNPSVRSTIKRRINFLRTQGKNNIKLINLELNKTLRRFNVEAKIIGREKSPFSIWKKMQKKNISFEQLSDIMAFKIVVNNIDKCYSVLKAIHLTYPTLPGRFKDYISLPKQNGYKSIHTSIFGPAKQKIEVQIKTNEMEEIAELGAAAHWQYKNSLNVQEGKKYKWIRELVEIVENSSEPEEFLENTKLEMFKDQVFCFTPKGDLISLPEKSTPVDFAYAVHSELGDICTGAKINGKILPLKTYLKNGDQVEIITSKFQKPSPSWVDSVQTPKAKSRIKKFIKAKERIEYLSLGQKILKHFFSKNKKEINESHIQDILSLFNCHEIEDLYFNIGKANIDPMNIFYAIYPSLKKQKKTLNKNIVNKQNEIKDNDNKDRIPLKGLLPGLAFSFSKCCYPLPGERIVGLLTKGRGVAVHTSDCNELGKKKYKDNKILDVSWDNKNVKLEEYISRIRIVILNEPGNLGEIASAIGNNKGNIINLKLTSRQKTFFEMIIDVKVKNLKHLSHIMAAIRSLESVSIVDRDKG